VHLVLIFNSIFINLVLIVLELGGVEK